MRDPDGWASTILQEAGSVEIPVTVILHVKIVKAIQVEGVASIAKLRDCISHEGRQACQTLFFDLPLIM